MYLFYVVYPKKVMMIDLVDQVIIKDTARQQIYAMVRQVFKDTTAYARTIF
jgi:hypothetical protein